MTTNILVTGGAGFIGSHTVDLLLEHGYKVRILDNLASPVHIGGNLPDYISTEVEFLQGDVRDKDAWESALDNIDSVFHLAAYQDYLPDFSTFFHVNTVGTALLYETIVEHGLSINKVVLASSQAIYGEGRYECELHGVQHPPSRSEQQLEKKQWDPLCPVCEGKLDLLDTSEMHVGPHNSYAMSKYTQEMMGMVLGRRYNIPTVAMRYSIVQGARQSFRNAYSGVLRIFAMQALVGGPLTAYEDGDQIRDYVNVIDVARANVMVLEDVRADFQSFNVGGGRRVTVNEFGSIMAETVGAPDIKVVSAGEYRFGDTRHIVSDISQIGDIGWVPLGTVEMSVQEYLEWAQKQSDFGDYATSARSDMRALGTVRGGT